MSIEEDKRDEMEDVRFWLLEAVEREVVRIELRLPGEVQTLGQWSLSRTLDAARLARTICRQADSDAEHRHTRGPLLYAVLAFRADNVEVCKVTLRSRRSGALNEDGTMEGLMALLMKHSEKSNKIAIGHTGEVIKQYEKMLCAANARIAMLEGRLTEVGEVYEMMTTRQHERELETMREKRDDRRMDFFASKLDLLVPVALGKLLTPAKGKDGAAKGEGSATPPVHVQEEKIRQLMRSIRPEQVPHLMAALSPEQILAMTTLMEDYRIAEESKADKQPAAASQP